MIDRTCILVVCFLYKLKFTIMKKVFYLLLLFPLLMVSCDDDHDDDFPKVSISINLSGAKVIDGTIYVVQGDTLSIDSIGVMAVNQNQQVAIVATSYYWDKMYVGTSTIPPFEFSVDTGLLMKGRHLLQMRSSLIAVDYAPVVAIITYPVKIVAEETDIPNGEVETTLFIIPDIDD